MTAQAPATPATPPPAAPATPSPREYARVLLVAAALGVPIALVAALFMSLLHGATTLVWNDIPDAANWSEPPAWYVLAIPALAGVLVALALRLPGRGGDPAVEGLSLNPLTPLQLPSMLVAATITLGCGLVLGPEAPLTALGLTGGLVAARALKPGAAGRQILVVAGAFAAISTVFGGPLPAALLLFEMAARSGTIPSASLGAALLPGFLASGTAALVFTGVDDWPGVHLNALTLPPLPAYPTVHIVDLLWCLLIAVVTGATVAGARRAARDGFARGTSVSPFALLAGAGLVVGLLAVLFRAITGEPVNLVLFSGETAMPQLVAESSAGVLVALIVAKGAAYAISLGAGFRGGPTFPAVALGVATGALGAIVLPGLHSTPAIIAGVAAGAAAGLELPFFGALLAAVMAGSLAVPTMPIAVIASVVGWLVATAVHAREAPSSPQAS